MTRRSRGMLYPTPVLILAVLAATCACLAPVASAADVDPNALLSAGTYRADYGGINNVQNKSPYGRGWQGYLTLTKTTVPSTAAGTFRMAAPGGKTACKAQVGLLSVADATSGELGFDYVLGLSHIKKVGKRAKRFCKSRNRRLVLHMHVSQNFDFTVTEITWARLSPLQTTNVKIEPFFVLNNGGGFEPWAITTGPGIVGRR